MKVDFEDNLWEKCLFKIKSCYDPSLELSWQDCSSEGSQHVFVTPVASRSRAMVSFSSFVLKFFQLYPLVY